MIEIQNIKKAWIGLWTLAGAELGVLAAVYIALSKDAWNQETTASDICNAKDVDPQFCSNAPITESTVYASAVLLPAEGAVAGAVIGTGSWKFFSWMGNQCLKLPQYLPVPTAMSAADNTGSKRYTAA